MKKLKMTIQNPEQLNAGTYIIKWIADGLGEGIYFCMLKTKEGIQTKKIIKIN